MQISIQSCLLARLIEDGNLAKTITLAGTLGFVAPKLHYTGKANEKSDVYSFGVLLLTVACGRPPLDDTYLIRRLF
ncbi:hypothetical protein O6H91_18G012300 [Diphasiastrum complanatum]|uniref:Uncharacterized protein n=1 Tax=Diphasiastrum complanatum TaxID=34168 RepID=A0ACC2AYB0_DIPCM|nr:hypothetical protein O6H91_18G012300 [Diphasiastrum complanatum]